MGSKMKKRSEREILADLPEMAMLTDLVTGETIAVRKGERGYWPMPNIKNPDAWNERHGITKAQAEAMQVGSMFGFDCPGADPLNN